VENWMLVVLQSEQRKKNCSFQKLWEKQKMILGKSGNLSFI